MHRSLPSVSTRMNLRRSESFPSAPADITVEEEVEEDLLVAAFPLLACQWKCTTMSLGHAVRIVSHNMAEYVDGLIPRPHRPRMCACMWSNMWHRSLYII